MHTNKTPLVESQAYQSSSSQNAVHSRDVTDNDMTLNIAQSYFFVCIQPEKATKDNDSCLTLS